MFVFALQDLNLTTSREMDGCATYGLTCDDTHPKGCLISVFLSQEFISGQGDGTAMASEFMSRQHPPVNT